MVDNKSLLLTFLRKGNEEEIINQLRGLSGDQWEALLAIARRHKLGPILFYSLKPYYSSPHIPINYQDRIRNEYFSSAARNMRLYQQLEEVIKKFAKEDIPVILLKGPHLAKYIYENIALRPMGDIDLMVKRVDMEKVHQVLVEDGYINSKEEPLTYNKKGKVAIEIHLNLKGLPISENVNIISGLWERADKVASEELEALTLCPEDLILHLSLHNCVKHVFDNGLISCFDIAYIFNHYKENLSWEKLWSRGQEWGVERTVYLMLALTEKMIGLPIPEQVNQAIKTDQEGLDALAAAEILIFEHGFKDISSNIIPLFGQQGWRNKYNLIVQRISLSEESDNTSNQEESRRINYKQYLIYLSRLWTLFKAHRKTVWLGLRGDSHTVSSIEIHNKRNSLREWLSHIRES